MELIVLGSHGTWPLAGGATSGYLVRHDGFALWVDQGTGTLANLQMHMDLMDVDGIVLSHAHPDHFLDLYPTFYARHFNAERPLNLPLFAPPGLFERAGRLMSGDAARDMGKCFRVTEVEPGSPFEIGPFRVDTVRMNHPPPTLGMRFQADGATLAYTADTGPTDAVVELAEGADVLLSEATWPAGYVSDLDQIHLSGQEAGTYAARSGVGRLILTHIWPNTERRRSLEEATSTFDGPVHIAEEGMVMEVTP